MAGIDSLLYSSDRDLHAWDRFRLRFSDGGSLAVRDPRRLGGVELEPDVSGLGPDAGRIGRAGLARVLRSAAGLKAVLLDQRRIAGIGNLLADEILWQAGLSPVRPAGSLGPDEVAALRSEMRRTLRVLTARGGSHTGDLMPHRTSGGVCPRDDTPLRRATVGGRSTWWCAHHQR